MLIGTYLDIALRRTPLSRPPVWALNRLGAAFDRRFASLRDEEGRILIDGFYDDVRAFSAAEKAAFAATPPIEEQMRGELRLGRTEGGTASLSERSEYRRRSPPFADRG